jgi:hypothetical protein
MIPMTEYSTQKTIDTWLFPFFIGFFAGWGSIQPVSHRIGLQRIENTILIPTRITVFFSLKKTVIVLYLYRYVLSMKNQHPLHLEAGGPGPLRYAKRRNIVA